MRTKKTIRITQPGSIPAAKNIRGIVGARIYASREVVKLPFGVTLPAPASWELVDDRRVEIKRGRLRLPVFDLEPTAAAPGRVKFYAFMTYDEAGGEGGKCGNIFELPYDFAPEITFGDLFGLYAQNLPANDERYSRE